MSRLGSTRPSSGAPAFSPVSTRSVHDLRPGWTPEEVIALLEQGYGVPAVVRRTGCDQRWAEVQLARLSAPGGRAGRPAPAGPGGVSPAQNR